MRPTRRWSTVTLPVSGRRILVEHSCRTVGLLRHVDQGFSRSQRNWRMLLPAGALAGNPFLVDRQFIARELGFVGGVCPNSMDAVGAAGVYVTARVRVVADPQGGLLRE